jgi:hypothetical protein
MKNIILLILIVFTFGIAGCEDFLDTSPTLSVGDESVFTSVKGAQVALNGVYNRLRMTNGTDAAAAGHIAGLNNCMDAACDDVMSTVKAQMRNWMSNQNGALTLKGNADNTDMFKMWYTVINNANAVIKYTPEASGDQIQKDYIIGQALTMRALCYYYLVRFYQHPVTVAGDAPSIPYLEDPGLNYQPRATVSYVYEKILDDLTTALELLDGFSRGSDKGIFDRQIAQAFLADVYLTMENFEGAATMARAARQGYSLMTGEEYRSGFNNDAIGEVMWALSHDTQQTLRNKVPSHWWANDNRARIGADWTFTWNSLWAAPAFVSLFEVGDVRHQFWKDNRAKHWRSDKFFDVVANDADIIMLRAAELYLIEAEALVRGNIDLVEARHLLNELQVSRNATPAEATFENIKIERRKELYGEGRRWFDIIRYREALVRGPGNQFSYTIPAKSNLFRFQIPQVELDLNPEITENDQNELTGEWPE